MVSTPHKLPYVEKIGPGNPSYMIRLHLTPWKWWTLPRLYLHILGRPDEDREYHDHPWGFTTLVLWGGYTETSHIFEEIGDQYFPTGKHHIDRLGFLSIRKRYATHAHLITQLHAKRVVTLVMRDNKRQRDWGFWKEVWNKVGGGRKDSGAEMKGWKWVPWYEYMGKPKPDYESY